MSKRTPGPWVTGHMGILNLWVGPSHKEKSVCFIPWDLHPIARPEARANARLIAAAGTAATKAEELFFDGQKAIEALPELLAVLMLAAQFIENGIEIGRINIHPQDSSAQQTLPAIRAAIAKARPS